MENLVQQSRLATLIKQRNGYLVLAFGLLMLCCMLTIFCMVLSGRERIVIVPPVIDHAFWVTHSEVSPEYLSEMTTFFAYLRLNVTPASIDTQRQILLRYTDPKNYGTLNNVLIAERDRVVEQHLSTAFYPVDVKVNIKLLTAQIEGDILSSIGNTQLPPQRAIYNIQYHYHQGKLWVTQFQEVQVNDKK